jgi:aspartate racemase
MLEGEYTPEETEAWAADYLKVVRQIQPEGPYMLGGMCTGALIAFDMAIQLEAQGQQVALLAIFDTWDRLTLNRLWVVNYYLRHLRVLRRQSQQVLIKAFLKKIGAALQNIVRKSVPSSSGEEPLVQHNPWKTGYKPNVEFVPTIFSGHLTVYRIHRRPYFRIRDEALGWCKRVRGEVDVEYVPGEHSTILRDPNVQVVARNLRQRIRALKQSQKPSCRANV